jgi:membrane fusion protein, multidrug efflux system
LRWIALLALAATACSDVPTVQTATATRRSLVVPILADGTLEPPPGGEVRAPEGAVVGGILAREGQRVARGTPLLRLDNPELAQRVLAGRAESQQLAAQLAAAQDQRARLHAIADSDARLAKSGAIPKFEAEQSADRARQADAQVADLARRKEIADRSTGELESRAGFLTLRAPSDGLVYNLPRPGESIMPGQLLATVSDPLHIRVRARVDAPDLPRLRAGQRFVVTFDGLPNERWQGRIILVPPGLRIFASREVGEVIGEISGDASALPANASVNVEIVVGERPAALVIPRGALQRDGSARFVYRYEDEKARRTPVAVGLIGPTDVEIARGLSEGDRVILPGNVVLRDGQTVKVRS